MKRVIWARVGLVILSIGGLITLYQIMFDIWMTAYPFADANEWRVRLYIRLVTAVVIGLLCIVIAVWLYRQRRRGKPTV